MTRFHNCAQMTIHNSKSIPRVVVQVWIIRPQLKFYTTPKKICATPKKNKEETKVETKDGPTGEYEVF